MQDLEEKRRGTGHFQCLHRKRGGDENILALLIPYRVEEGEKECPRNGVTNSLYERGKRPYPHFFTYLSVNAEEG